MKIQKLSNGLTIICEERAGASAVSCSLLLPVGVVNEPERKLGLSGLSVEMLSKGAGELGKIEFSQALDDLGVQHSSSAGLEASVFSMALLGENLPAALKLLSYLITLPKFPEEELIAVKALAIQDLAALEDEPASKAAVELNARFYPGVFGRSVLGTREGIEASTIEDVREYYKKFFVPGGAVLSFAGKLNTTEVFSLVEKYFSNWSGDNERIAVGKFPEKDSSFHIEKDSSQVQIAMAFRYEDMLSSDYAKARLAIGIMSGGMAGRLFVEVREKRGLVYRVSASHVSARGRGSVMTYAGTTEKNAAETLEVIEREYAGLADGISEEELARAKADIKSKIVLRSEISSARASHMAHDWWVLGRVRELDEIKHQLDAVSVNDLVEFCQKAAWGPKTVVTLGPKWTYTPIANDNSRDL